ncbi:MAG: rubrerythrin [Clostridia bacterium]|nr:ferritin family protein [Eubacteriales bacterium]NCC48973.1 rubrerythrin [Clostridia bacterium]
MSLIQFAIKMEKDGEAYYEKQVEQFKGQPIARVFGFLAEAERKHAALLASCDAGQPVEYEDPALNKARHVFSDLKNYRVDETAAPRQLEVYRYAMEIEQKSIDLYRKLRTDSGQDAQRELLDFLVEQEEDHYALFEQLTELVERPEAWVEDAEFGQREDY